MLAHIAFACCILPPDRTWRYDPDNEFWTQQKSYRWDETSPNTTPTNVWAILLVVCRLLPPNHLVPTEKFLLVYSPGGMLCVSASIGWCSTQNNILSQSMPVVFTLSAFFFYVTSTQFGFYPDRSTIQPMFILRHLVHAAKQIKPKGCSHRHTAFIDFKQAYDTIDRPHLWDH